MLKKLKLTTKLLGSFLVVLAIMIIVGVVGYRAMIGVADRADKMGDVERHRPAHPRHPPAGKELHHQKGRGVPEETG